MIEINKQTNKKLQMPIHSILGHPKDPSTCVPESGWIRPQTGGNKSVMAEKAKASTAVSQHNLSGREVEGGGSGVLGFALALLSAAAGGTSCSL